MNRLSRSDRIAVLRCLAEGCSVNSTVRMTGVSQNTVLSFILDVGAACMAFEDRMNRNLACRFIECDEIWGFCGMKQKQVPQERRGELGVGDVWTWVAIDRETKLMITYLLGGRDGEHARALMGDLSRRVVGRPQITTDALGVYEPAVANAFERGTVDYVQLHKSYSHAPDVNARYSPPVCIACEKKKVFGSPDMAKASTSFVERTNLTIRMTQRRWTRLTNGHSKSFDHMEAAFAFHAMHFNWVRKHATLKTTPAKAAGLTDREWTLDDVVELVEAEERAAIAAGALKRGSYKPRKPRTNSN